MHQRLILVILGTGFSLLLISFIAKPAIDARPNWTAEQGRDFEAATTHLHAISHQHGNRANSRNHSNGESIADKDEFQAAQEKYRQLKSELDRARSRGQNLAKLAYCSGIVLIAFGFVGFIATRYQQPPYSK